MNSMDLVLMGLRNLWRRKLRTFLTVLGVLIGTSSIIVMLSLGFGMQEFFLSQLSQMGDLTTINVYKSYSGYETTSRGTGGNEAVLNDKTIENFKNIPHVVAVTPIIETWGTIKTGKYISQTSIRGIDPDSMKYFEYEIAEGRLLQQGDDFHVVFGGGMKHTFYNDKASRMYYYEEPDVDLMNDRMIFTFDTGTYENIPGQDVDMPKYKDYRIKAVGVLQEGNWETDYSVFAPIDTVKKMIEEKERAEHSNQRNQSRSDEYERALIKADNIDNVENVQQTIRDMGFDAYSLSDQLKELERVSNMIQAVLGGIGAISLLVAAIGITNTMVMSIYERTKEIGIMKVIGASLRDIKRLFLFESALIGLLGGILGTILSFILSFGLNKFGGNFLINMGVQPGTKISIIPFWLIFLALTFSALIGIISGYYPAKRAMKLSALDAIRTE